MMATLKKVKAIRKVTTIIRAMTRLGSMSRLESDIIIIFFGELKGGCLSMNGRS